MLHIAESNCSDATSKPCYAWFWPLASNCCRFPTISRPAQEIPCDWFHWLPHSYFSKFLNLKFFTGSTSGRCQKHGGSFWRVEKSLTPILFSLYNYIAAMGNILHFEGVMCGRSPLAVHRAHQSKRMWLIIRIKTDCSSDYQLYDGKIVTTFVLV